MDWREKRFWQNWLAWIFFIGILIVQSQIGFCAEETINGNNQALNKPIIVTISIGLIFLIIGIFVGFMFILQSRYLKVCDKSKQVDLFSISPAGLPQGTVRSMIALIIVTISLYFIALKVLGLTSGTFPEALNAILGAVIGFYFGARSAAKSEDKAIKMEVKSLESQRDEAIQEKESNVIKKVQKAVNMIGAATVFLPEDKRKVYEGVTSKLKEGIKIVEKFSSKGDFTDALEEANKIFDSFKKSNPVRDVVEKASASFSQVLGGTIPHMALIMTIAGLGTKLAGSIYQKWKIRILHGMFSPADLPLKAIDSNTGFSLVWSSPILKERLKEKLEANDRVFLGEFAKLCLESEDPEDRLWSKYQKFFESREQFRRGIKQLQRGAADTELREKIDAGALAEVGGYNQFMAAIDSIHKDDTSKAALDELVLVIEGLKQEGEPVLSIFDKVQKEVSP